MKYIESFLSIISPIIYGLALAYLINPILNLFEKHIFRWKVGNKKWKSKLKRGLSILCSFLLIFSLLAGLIGIFIPQAVKSYKLFINNMDAYGEDLADRIDKDIESFFSKNSFLQKIYDIIKNKLGVDADTTLVAEVISKVAEWFGNLFSIDNLKNLISAGKTVVSVVVDVALSVLFSVYLLFSKERQLSRFRKLMFATFKERTVYSVFRIGHLADKRVGRYLRVQLLDSLIVGVVSYFVYMIFDIPYYQMLALISGVTNIIPYFGPFIGAIPNGIFILLIEPSKLLPFIIIVLVIQQLDGNFLVPMLQSNNMKMDVFWVLVGMTIMGGIFGLPGMILGVPVFSVIFVVIREWTNERLAKKGMPVDSKCYMRQMYQIQDEYEHDLNFKERLSGIWESMKGRFKKKDKNIQSEEKASDGEENTPPKQSFEEHVREEEERAKEEKNREEQKETVTTKSASEGENATISKETEEVAEKENSSEE